MRNDEIKKYLQLSNQPNFEKQVSLDAVYEETVKRNYNDFDDRVRTVYISDPVHHYRNYKDIFKKVKIGLLVALIAFFAYSKKDFVEDYIRFMYIVQENNVSMSELTDAVKGMVPERNNNINEYNNMLDRLVTMDIGAEVVANDFENDLTLAFEKQDKSIGASISDAFTKDTREQAEAKYMEKLDNYLISVKSNTQDKLITDEPDSWTKNFADGWTGFLSIFGGKTVEEKYLIESKTILESLTNFVFYDTEIEKVKYEDLTYQAKMDTLDVTLYTYRAMERRYETFKSGLDEETIYPTLESRLMLMKEFLEQTEKIDTNYYLIKDYLSSVNYGEESILKKTNK